MVMYKANHMPRRAHIVIYLLILLSIKKGDADHNAHIIAISCSQFETGDTRLKTDAVCLMLYNDTRHSRYSPKSIKTEDIYLSFP